MYKVMTGGDFVTNFTNANVNKLVENTFRIDVLWIIFKVRMRATSAVIDYEFN